MRGRFKDVRDLANERLFLLDVEGDGGPGGGTPVETSLIEIEAGRFVAEHRWLTNPGVAVNPSARRVHGIDDAMLEGCPAMEEVAGEIEKLVRGQTVVGLAVGNDLNMLRKKIPGIDFLAGRIVDVGKLSYLAPSGRKNMGLDNLCADLGIALDLDDMPFGGRTRRHGSSVDAWLTGKCLFALIGRLEGAEPAVIKQASITAFIQISPERERLLVGQLEAADLPVPTGRIR